MDDRDIAGDEVGKLGEEEGRAEVVGQPLVEEFLGRRGCLEAFENGGIDGEIPFAAARTDDDMGVRQDLGLARDAGVIEGKPGGIGAHPLPVLHLALVAPSRDLLVEIERHQRVHEIGSAEIAVDDRLRAIGERHSLPMRVGSFAETGGESDAGDPHLARHGRALPVKQWSPPGRSR